MSNVEKIQAATLPHEEPTWQVVLASGSPRRRDLLSQAGVSFSVCCQEVDESLEPDLAAKPEEAAKKLAERKACATVERLLNGSPDGVYCVIGADTMVVLDGVIFGKPDGPEEARSMIDRLSGRTHQVITGVSLWMIAASADDPDALSVGFRSFADIAQVTFGCIPAEEREAYLATSEPYDKAGAYALQGWAGRFVEKIDGSEDTVIGLPVRRLLRDYPELLQAGK